MTIDDYLDLVQAAIEAMPEFAGIGVVVDKQQDVEAVKAEYLAKSKGYAVIIGEVSNRISNKEIDGPIVRLKYCLLYTSPSPRDKRQSRMPSSA